MIKKIKLFSKNKKAAMSLTFAFTLLMLSFTVPLNTAAAVPTVYNLFYNVNGGTNSVKNQAAYDDADLPLTLYDPSLPGHQFLYWRAIFENGSKVPLNDSTIPVGTTGAITLAAIWDLTPIIYDINYVLNGGVNAPGNPLKYHVWCDFPMNVGDPTKSGSVFAGWMVVYSNATATGPVTSYSIPAGTLGDITLVAMW